MKTPRKHLRLDFKRSASRAPIDSRLEGSRKRLIALALGASLTGAAGCGDLEPIPAPDTGVIAPMPPPQDTGPIGDSGWLDDSGSSADVGSETDASAALDAGDFTDAGATDRGELPPMPPPRDAGERPDLGPIAVDTGEVPPMPPPRDTGVSRRDVGPATRDLGRER